MAACPGTLHLLSSCKQVSHMWQCQVDVYILRWQCLSVSLRPLVFKKVCAHFYKKALHVVFPKSDLDEIPTWKQSRMHHLKPQISVFQGTFLRPPLPPSKCTHAKFHTFGYCANTLSVLLSLAVWHPEPKVMLICHGIQTSFNSWICSRLQTKTKNVRVSMNLLCPSWDYSFQCLVCIPFPFFFHYLYITLPIVPFLYCIANVPSLIMMHSPLTLESEQIGMYQKKVLSEFRQEAEKMWKLQVKCKTTEFRIRAFSWCFFGKNLPQVLHKSCQNFPHPHLYHVPPIGTSLSLPIRRQESARHCTHLNTDWQIQQKCCTWWPSSTNNQPAATGGKFTQSWSYAYGKCK